MSVGFDTWYQKQCPVVFKVMNIAAGGKRVRVFSYPIENGRERDLMSIPYVSEADIKHSLLKGELYNKLVCKELIVTDSSIDLITFDQCNRNFLTAAGVKIGLDAGGGGGAVNYLFRENVSLIGVLNNSNRVFYVPFGEKFINGTLDSNEFRIMINHNGRLLIENIDYLVEESVSGMGYDTIEFISFVPNNRSKIIADYVVHV